MRYTWPGRGRAGVDFALRRHDFNAFTDIHAPEGLFDEIFGHRADYLRVLENLGAFTDANRWIPLGPTGMINGQATGNPVVAGRVRDLKIAPDGSRAYAGSANGGVWVTLDAGQSWAPLGSWGVNPSAASGTGGRVQSLTIGALDVEFGATPDDDVIYAATGELRAITGRTHADDHAGVGILRLDGALSSALGNIGSIPWLREGTAMRGAGIFRLTHEPGVPLSFDPTGANVMIAASSSGLYFRDGPFVPDAAWDRIERAPFNFDVNSWPHVSDVLWTGSTPKRIYAALTHNEGGKTAIYVTEGGPDSNYSKINLNGVRRTARLSLAVAPSNPDVVYVLGTGAHNRARLWRIEGTGPARVIDDVPPGLFGKPKMDGSTVKVDGNSSFYNNSIAVDPANENIVYVAGSTIRVSNVSNANMHKLTISGTHAANDYSTDFNTSNNLAAETDPTYFGTRAHADVHAIRPVGSEVWIGCDGGVFVDRGAGMVSLNYGLAVSEPGFVACHPNTPGALIAGTQDNGRIERVGGSIWRLWRKGDGGGVAYHTTNPAYYLGQYTEASWRENQGRFTRPVFRTTVPAGTDPPQSETDENDASLFYSGIAAVAGEVDETRIAVGTTRVWFSPDWNPENADNTWVTLPSGEDARTPGSENDNQDKFGDNEQAVTLRWAQRGDTTNDFDGARLLVLTTKNIFQYSYDATEDTWTPHRFTEKKMKNRIRKNEDIETGPSEKLPYIGKWTDVFPHDRTRGSHGSFYVATTSKSKMTDTGEVGEADRMDTLWWFDGDETWHPTGLRNQGLDPVAGTSGTKAPQYAVVVHPDDPNIVFVGGSAGVWRGVLSFSGNTPSWSWTGELNGLPQAIVQDLVIYREGDLRLLRAALESRGIWELNISDTSTSVGNTYLRVTNLDTRQAEIDAAPIDPLSVTNPPATFTLDMSPDIYVYDAAAPIRPAPPSFWGTGVLPNEAQMFEQTEIGRTANMLRYRHAVGTYPTYVMVHHRDTDPLAGNQVTVVLLRLANAPGDLTTVPIDTPWRQAVLALMDGSSNTPPAGWELAEPGTPRRNLTGPIEARVPRAVEFSADLSHPVTDASGTDAELLVGIVSSTRDPLSLAQLNRNNLAVLIRRSRKVAARRFRRRS